jgi:hypothetical protein
MKRIHFPKTESAIRGAMERGAEARKALGKAMMSLSPMLSGRSLHTRSGSNSGSGDLGATASSAAASLPPLPPLYDVLRELWSKPVRELPVSKDLARLARRTEVVDEIVGKEIFVGKSVAETLLAKVASTGTSAAAASTSSGTVSREAEQKVTAELVVNLVLTIAKTLETKDKYKEIEAELRGGTLTNYSGTSDLITLCEEVISILGEDGSATVRVLKTIQQDIVLHSTIMLKEQLTKKYLTKDVRTADGWRIVVLLSEERVQVLHIRREQSVDEHGNSANHWEYEWELRMMFSPDMTEMQSVQLRITDLYLAETIDAALEDDLRKTIVGDIIVV